MNARGSVFAWGTNIQGELGVGDTDNRVVPSLVTRLLANQIVVQVTAG